MLYEYKCKTCGHMFEKLRSIAQRDDPQDCPECGSDEIRRCISEAKFTLKGRGWARDGYSKVAGTPQPD